MEKDGGGGGKVKRTMCCTPVRECRYWLSMWNVHQISVNFFRVSSTNGEHVYTRDSTWANWLADMIQQVAYNLWVSEWSLGKLGVSWAFRPVKCWVSQLFWRNYILVFIFIIQARDISANVEVGQGRQVHKHPPVSYLLYPLRWRQTSCWNCFHRKSLK